MSNIENPGRFAEIINGARASLALCATAGALACGLGKPPEAMAHPVTADGAVAAAAPASPFESSLPTRPVTKEEIESYMPIAFAESPNSRCNTPTADRSHGYNIRVLPGSDDDTDTSNDMMTIHPDGSVSMVMARSKGGCNIDFLNFTVVGSQGKYNICTTLAHESKHEDTSLSPDGYIAPLSEQDPSGLDKKHDFNNSHSLMFVRNLIQDYDPCARVTTALEPPIVPPQPAKPMAHKPHSASELAIRATDYIPRLKNLEDVECVFYHRSPKTPKLIRRLCFSGENPRFAKNGAIVTLNKLTTLDAIDGSEEGKPDFRSDKIPDRVAQRYLVHGSLSTKKGRLAYRLAKDEKVQKSTPLRHAKAAHV